MFSALGVMIGVVLKPCWDPCCVTLVGGPSSPPQRRGSILGPPFGTILGSLLGPLWNPLETLGDPKEARRGPKALRRGLRRGSLRRSPKMYHFRTPPEEAEVGSRLHESTVFTVSPGSPSDPILAPFWYPFWVPGLHYSHQGGPRGARRGSERESKFGVVF